MPTEAQATKAGRLAFRAIKHALEEAGHKFPVDIPNATGLVLIVFLGHDDMHTFAVGEISFAKAAHHCYQLSELNKEIETDGKPSPTG